LLYHESDLRIEEHYTDTAGFTDHVFALCHLRGFRFAPRIRDLADKRLYVSDPDREYGTLAPLVGGRLHLKLITAQWEEVLRVAASIRHGTVTASLITCNNQRNTSSAKPTYGWLVEALRRAIEERHELPAMRSRGGTF
jgi:TnpA family transposase